MSFIRLVFYECLYFTNFRNKMYQFLLFIQPIVYLFIVKYMLMMRDGVNEEKYLFAIGIMSMWSYVLYSSGSSLVSLHWSGTFEIILNTNTSVYQILLSKAISNSIIGALTIVITLAYAKLIFSFQLSFDFLLGIIVSTIVLIFSLISIGMLLSILYSFSNNVYAHQNLIAFPMMLVSGIFYPVHMLPEAVQFISNVIPMSWAIDALYYTVENNTIPIIPTIISLVISIIYFLLSYLILKRMTQKIKETSVMGVF
ncbi:ABC transporter permease [Robertmurraya massiliosenegalensis]|uniref:ABC transporter permease n=1 Tax=Robertmurraya TaxID=2837507 RepID=UPI0039A5E830